MNFRQKFTAINAYVFIVVATIILLLHHTRTINETTIPVIKVLAVIVLVSWVILLITIPFFHKKREG